jgi:cyclomaltodextrinase / maltogenic alpha-amylase / neopullulanase
MSPWFEDAIFYHIYPLGCAGAPEKNDYTAPPVPRLARMHPWISYIRDLGVNALYLGPLFESATHGYDTKDYFALDRRLGTNDDLRRFIEECHQQGIRVIFDAVFNHVGRDHFAFDDLRKNGWNSQYRSWFYTDFGRKSSFGDQFWYEGWSGHYKLVKLNLSNQSVRSHIFDVISFWVNEFGIDGLRIDAADVMDRQFFCEMRNFCKSLKDDFWLMGEVIHGNYRDWANRERLHSTTNYECFKGLWSSHNDGNYFEIAYSMNRQYGTEGLYKELKLYNFTDNHDVDRVASKLKDQAHLFTLYILLFTIPGIPSIYYGSEWGIGGKKENNSDSQLRPAIDITTQYEKVKNETLYKVIKNLIALRKQLAALRKGSYSQLLVASKQYCFLRQFEKETTVICVNADKVASRVEFAVLLPDGTILRDVLNNQEEFVVRNGRLHVELFPHWGKILV